MPNPLKIALTTLVVLSQFAASSVRAAELEPITPRDCTLVRRVPENFLASPIQINPQRTLVAYLVNSPNLETNRNDVQLYVRDFKESKNQESVLVLSEIEMHDLHWLGDGTHLAALVRDDGHLVVVIIDVIKKTRTIAARVKNKDIEEFSNDQFGKSLVFSTDTASYSNIASPDRLAVERGYLIRPNPPTDRHYYQAQLFVVSRTGESQWSTPIRLPLSSPFTHQPIQSLPYLILLHLSLSPDGKSLLFSFFDSEHIPDLWLEDPTVKHAKIHGAPIELIALYTMKTHETTVSLASANVYRTPVWSADSASYIAVTTEAINKRSFGEATDAHIDFAPPHVYRVEKTSDAVEDILPNLVIPPEILSMNLRGEVVLRSGEHEIVVMHRDGSSWTIQATVTLPIPAPRSLSYSPLASDGEHLIGDYEDAATPPEIYSYAAGDQSIRVLARLNPQFEQLRIAPTRTITWQSSDGYALQGTLWLPPNYKEGEKYPLVIQTKPDYGDFACDSGGNHDPSFAPQPIADAGMIYMARIWPKNYRFADDAAHYPKGFPGGIAEAAFHMDMWDSAVEALIAKGMIDPNRIGIIGFSRSGWYTEFALAHSKTNYRAATAADNYLYSMGDYWLHQTEQSVSDGDLMYGGSPYGSSQNNWLKYSISFNLDKLHTPILMEVFGEGAQYSPGKLLPDVLAPSFEITTALAQLHKPGVLYYYQNDVHQPNHPQTRLGSLQRNLDWYRFWLQGFERSDSDASEQYREWRSLKESDETRKP